MAISWGTALGAQDDSIEGMLAKRDMTKQIQMLAQLAKQQEDTRQFNAGHQLDRQQLIENVRLRQAQQEATQQQREEMTRERERDNKRGLYGQMTSGRKPGDRVGKSALDVIAEFEGGTGDYAPDPNDPLQFIYKAEEAKRLLAKAESDERMRQAAEKRAQEDQARQRKQFELQQKAAERAEKEEQRRAKEFEMKEEKFVKQQAEIQKRVEALPVHLRPAVKARAEQKIKDAKTLNPLDDDRLSAAKAWAEAAMEVEQEARKNGQMPPGPGSASVPLTGGQSKETPEQRFQRLMKAAQGSK